MTHETKRFWDVVSATFLLSLVFVAVLVLCGCKDKVEDIPTDGPVEEFVEVIIEDYVEHRFDLPDDMLKDRIDLTPWNGDDPRGELDV